MGSDASHMLCFCSFALHVDMRRHRSCKVGILHVSLVDNVKDLDYDPFGRFSFLFYIINP